MKSIAVIYASVHGTSEKVANYISGKLGDDNCQLLNLKTEKNVDLSPYNTVVLGASVHAGQLHATMRKFCKNNLTNLLEKKLVIYMCGMNEPEYENAFAKGFPEILRNHSSHNAMAGGEYNFEKMNFFEKFIVKKIAGVESSQSNLKFEVINELCHAVGN